MSDDATLKRLIAHVADGKELSRDDAYAAFDAMMSGTTTPAQTGALLMALRVRGETVGEIAAGAKVMREKSLKVGAPSNAIDNCGTGGDASGTWNISTGAAFVVAACGVPLAKHGNRALSSKSGTAQALEELGVNINTSPEKITECIEKAGMGFMMAPNHHAAMKHVAPIRMELGTRTIFNLLGPLSNPAGTKRQLIGVFSKQWVEPFSEVLRDLGSEKVWIVHGEDGLDEITTTGATHVAELDQGQIRTFTITPEEVGLARARPEDLKGGDPKMNAAKIKALLAGEQGPYRDIVLLNAAAALVVAGQAQDLPEGLAQAALAIDEGHAARVLETLVQVSNS
ncbi:MAG: anthranilate phosphoribosyltransferase [Alphaproteobacteria bacterium]|nr:MAG: anthranilate phosphoribosyltransferase [Alphaproteobacteria bacterium]